MRILLDESLPVELGAEFRGHDVATVYQMGWSALKNGELLACAGERFDVMLTADRNLEFQQNLRTLPVAVVVLAARSNRIADLRPLVPHVLDALASLEPHALVCVGT